MVVKSLKFLSGRRHRVYSAVTVIKKQDFKIISSITRTVCTILKFKLLTEDEIMRYKASGEGLNKAGGYSIEGAAQIFISWVSGSVSNVIGLPTHELYQILIGQGYKF